jgi:hypothetical protein
LVTYLNFFFLKINTYERWCSNKCLEWLSFDGVLVGIDLDGMDVGRELKFNDGYFD